MTAIDRAEVERVAAFLQAAARYFAHRPTGGEDMAMWANVYNSENATNAAALLLRLVDERDGARGYLGRILVSLYPQCEPLPDLMGVCTQIDNALTEISTLRAQRASARETELMEILNGISPETASNCLSITAAELHKRGYETSALLHARLAAIFLTLIQKDQPHD